MCRIDNSSWVPASVVSAALVTGSIALFAQTTTQTAPSATQPIHTQVLQTPPPSPEAVGDSLYDALGKSRPVRVLQRLRAVLFTPEQAELLGIESV